MQTVVEGQIVSYVDEGTGPAVLMLHGWKDDLHTFDDIAQNIQQTHRVVRIDMPGFGASAMPPDSWHVDDYVRFVASCINRLELENYALVGHSFGGRVCIKGVGTGVLEPTKLILIASAGVARRRTLKNTLLAFGAKIGRIMTLVPPFSYWKVSLRRELYRVIGSDYFAAGALKDTFVAVVSEDLTPYASSIRVPTLLLWGELDASTPLEQGKKIHSLIVGSTLHVIKGAGHFVHREKAQEISRLILSFL